MTDSRSSSSTATRNPAKLPLLLLVLAVSACLLAGCGLFRADAQIGPDLKPHLGTSVSLPLGK